MSIFSIVPPAAYHTSLCRLEPERFPSAFILAPVLAPLPQVVPFIKLDITALPLQTATTLRSFTVSECSLDFCFAVWTIKRPMLSRIRVVCFMTLISFMCPFLLVDARSAHIR